MPFSCDILPGSLSKKIPIPSIVFIGIFTFLIVLVAFSELNHSAQIGHNNWYEICPVQNRIFQWFDKLLLIQSKILFIFLYNHILDLCSFLINYYSKIFFYFNHLLFHLISSILYFCLSSISHSSILCCDLLLHSSYQSSITYFTNHILL